MPGNKNSGNRTGAPRAPGAGRPVGKVSIKAGQQVMHQHRPTGEFAPLVLGKVTELSRNLIKIELTDGTEVLLMV